MIRERFSGDLKQALQAQDAARAATLRLVCAAIKDRDANRAGGDESGGAGDAEVLEVLERMIRQREESARLYEESGRLDLAEAERREVGVLRDYMPKPMSEAEVRDAIDAAIAGTGAESIRDLAKVIAYLKAHHQGRMDFARACLAVKQVFG